MEVVLPIKVSTWVIFDTFRGLFIACHRQQQQNNNSGDEETRMVYEKIYLGDCTKWVIATFDWGPVDGIE